MSLEKKNIAIVGAGLVGSLLSIYFSKKGYEVTVFEGRGDMRKDSVHAGRSINLALSNRGRKALRKVSLEEKILSIYMPKLTATTHAEFHHHTS